MNRSGQAVQETVNIPVPHVSWQPHAWLPSDTVCKSLCLTVPTCLVSVTSSSCSSPEKGLKFQANGHIHSQSTPPTPHCLKESKMLLETKLKQIWSGNYFSSISQLNAICPSSAVSCLTSFASGLIDDGMIWHGFCLLLSWVALTEDGHEQSRDTEWEIKDATGLEMSWCQGRTEHYYCDISVWLHVV